MKKNRSKLYILSTHLLYAIVGIFILHPVSAQEYTTVGQEEQRPNIVIIMADDLDSHELSAYGGTNINTKNIDLLAKEGLKFNHFIASEAMCVPTRASLFTGLYPAKHGSYQNHKPVNKDLKSVAHYLNDLGYRVGLTGKNHVTRPFPFEIIPGFEPNCVSATDDYFLDSVETFINDKEKPYCLFVMSINPHAPWTVGDPSEFDASKLTLPKHWVDTELTRQLFTKYLAEVRRLDDQVGDVLGLLERSGQADNTIVIFLSEQGPQFPGGKWNLWDNGQKSGMLIRWPGRVNSGTETNAIAQYEDITPTLIDIAGGQPIENLDGKSFLDVINGDIQQHRKFAFGIHNNIPEGPAYPIRSIRDKDYKLILNLSADSNYYVRYMMNAKNENLAYTSWVEKAASDPQAKLLVERIANRPHVEFYDLKLDPNELVNLANDPKYQNKIDEMRHELTKWMESQDDKGAAMDVPFGRK
ncbi:sulfatase family protein [Sphingobacterium corticibacterium]|uniref:Heparan N-sulfatase n=1 Tax=Sphingobacterium corticibacterium TaxID=2484746 RepID=A0A4Q6XP01_9SPHI|nr:sulfatase [Sphingobacterium corticibacterium]RZF58339.1 heparan N-sulfatase [Sphingobacterium corticibacterium]